MWHPEAINATVERTLHDLSLASVLADFYLAGGTGLALHAGHRRSIDLDLFTSEAYAPDAILGKITRLNGLQVLAKDVDTLHVVAGETKVSFFTYRYPVLFPPESFSGVQVADPRDIACMKMSAIAGRGTKRDFIDLFIVAQSHGLEQILGWFKMKYAQVSYSTVHILKSLAYFEDADKDPTPSMLVSLTWESVKQFFTAEAPRLL